VGGCKGSINVFLKIKMLKHVNYNKKYIIDFGETMKERIIMLNHIYIYIYIYIYREIEKDFGSIGKIRSVVD
jgi:hypothetical protein